MLIKKRKPVWTYAFATQRTEYNILNLKKSNSFLQKMKNIYVNKKIYDNIILLQLEVKKVCRHKVY